MNAGHGADQWVNGSVGCISHEGEQMATYVRDKKYKYATRLNTVKRWLKGSRVIWRHDLSMRGTVIKVAGNHCTVKWDGKDFDEPRTLGGYTHYELIKLHAEREPDW
tara:strand:+ start:538 stop:858 length:321 start_codon:yes stop_codon:yes gene_type:complete